MTEQRKRQDFLVFGSPARCTISAAGRSGRTRRWPGGSSPPPAVRRACSSTSRIGRATCADHYHGKITRELHWVPRIGFEECLRSPIDCYRSHEAWWRVILSGAYQVYYQCQYGDHVGN